MTVEEYDSVRGSNRRQQLGRGLVAAFVLIGVLFWVWAFSPWARRENPARLDDRDFATWAEQRCVRAQAAIEALPSPRQAVIEALPSPRQAVIEALPSPRRASLQVRAGQIDRGTDEVAELVADLRSAVSADLSGEAKSEGPSDADLVRAWLADWDTYIDDRRAHAAKLRDIDGDAPDSSLRFLLSDAMSGGVYTERMDGFARLNDMDSCQIPGDL